jgi:hypothetical protein
VQLRELDDELRCAVDEPHDAAGVNDSDQTSEPSARKAMPFGNTGSSSTTSSPSPLVTSTAKIRPGREFLAGSDSPRGSVNHSRPSGPNARSFGPSSRMPPHLGGDDLDRTVGRDALDPRRGAPPWPMPPFWVT